MGGNSIYKELLEAEGYDLNTAITSAFVQQREKILPIAFEFLLHKFTKTFNDTKTYREYRLFAADGSYLNITIDLDDLDTHFQTNGNGEGCSLFHLNALYDLSSRLYVDALVQPLKHVNEHKAFVDMVKRLNIKGKAIIIADRGL